MLSTPFPEDSLMQDINAISRDIYDLKDRCQALRGYL
jgi:hypothetical protein